MEDVSYVAMYVLISGLFGLFFWQSESKISSYWGKNIASREFPPFWYWVVWCTVMPVCIAMCTVWCIGRVACCVAKFSEKIVRLLMVPIRASDWVSQPEWIRYQLWLRSRR